MDHEILLPTGNMSVPGGGESTATTDLSSSPSNPPEGRGSIPGIMLPPSSSSTQQYVLRSGRYVGRGGEVKVKRKCVEVACQPSVVFLLATVCMVRKLIGGTTNM